MTSSHPPIKPSALRTTLQHERYHTRAHVERGLDRVAERQNAMQYFALLWSGLGHKRRSASKPACQLPLGADMGAVGRSRKPAAVMAQHEREMISARTKRL
jgi:hypothetical protein